MQTFRNTGKLRVAQAHQDIAPWLHRGHTLRSPPSTWSHLLRSHSPYRGRASAILVRGPRTRRRNAAVPKNNAESLRPVLGILLGECINIRSPPDVQLSIESELGSRCVRPSNPFRGGKSAFWFRNRIIYGTQYGNIIK